MVWLRSVVGRVRVRGGGPLVRRGVPADLGGLAELVDGVDPVVGAAVRQRAGEVTAALAAGSVSGGTRAVLDGLVGALAPLDGARAWLLLATMTGRLPDGSQVDSLIRTAELDGVPAALARVIVDLPLAAPGEVAWPEVRVLLDTTLVDVQHTATREVATGIQRVTREVTRRWVRDHQPTLIGWHADLTAMRVLSAAEAQRACWGGSAGTLPADDTIVVPWRCTYLLPELAIEIDQVTRLQAMAQYSGTTLNLIGYDLVPVTTAETINEIIAPGFARNLSAVRYARNVAAISEAAAEEYRGWSAMLAGTGLPGPRIAAVPLPAEAPAADPDAVAAGNRRLRVGRLPLILVVGSHEPRKNHLSVLHAAELLWREGHQFGLTFIGGNAWSSEPFVHRFGQLVGAGRPMEAFTAATDELLWRAYRAARFTVFPSFNEGFGLPVAESLACGTPVITSNFGSMKEIADAGGGALLIDPRDDHDLVDAMRTLLTDDHLHAELSNQARSRPPRTWDDYADEVWAALASA